MTLALVRLNIILRIGVFEVLFLIGIHHIVGPMSVLAQSVCRTIAKHINDTTCTDTITTGPRVTTIDHTGIVGEYEVLSQVSLHLHVKVRTTHT